MTLTQMGIKIKQLRLRQQRTQQEIASECKISKSLLSKIENGQTSSAIATLSKIAKELNVPLAWLLEDTPEQKLVLQTKHQRVSKIGDVHMGYSYELLANKSKYSGVEPTIVHVLPKELNLREETYTHSHDEFIYILKGSMQLLFDNQKYLMHKGDTAYFEGTTPHLFIPVDNEGAEVLTLFIENNK